MDEAERIKREKLEKMKMAMKEKEMARKLDTPITITDDDFDSTISKYPLVLVDFWATWCPPCRLIAPVIEELAKEHNGKLICAKLNVDENPKSAAKYQTMSIPTLILFKNGRPVEKVVGAVPKSHLEEKIRPHL